MAKISRPILYVAVLGAAAYAVVVLTEPAPPPKKKPVPRTATTAATSPDGITPEDLTARFARYAPTRTHDPFVPRVVAARALPVTAAGAKSPALPHGKWVLTGIAAINGAKTALVENGASGETVFLKTGDKWNGLRVAGIGQQSVAFVSAEGQRTELGFPAPEDASKSPAPGAPGAVGPPGAAAPTPPTPPTAAPPPSRLASGSRGGANGS